MVWLMKCMPLSLINVSKHPNLVIIFSKLFFSTTIFLNDSLGYDFSNLVRYSIEIMMYLYIFHRLGFGKGLTKLIAHILNGRFD